MCWCPLHFFPTILLFHPFSLHCPLSGESQNQLGSSRSLNFDRHFPAVIIYWFFHHPFNYLKKDSFHFVWWSKHNWNASGKVTNWNKLLFQHILNCHCFTVAIHSHLFEALSPTPEWLTDFGWVPLFGFIIVTLCHPVLVGIICVLYGELFPTDIRTVSIGIVHAIQYLGFAYSTKMFPVLIQWFHFYGTNYYYAAFALALTIWGMLTIKDIDCLSLVEIEHIYDSRMAKSKCARNETGLKDPNYGSFKYSDLKEVE